MPPTGTITVTQPAATLDTQVHRNGNHKNGLNSEEGFLPEKRLTTSQLFIVRLIYLLIAFSLYWKADYLQGLIDTSWVYLRQQWWFQTVYFETVLVIVYSFPSTFIFEVIDMIPYFDKFRIAKTGGVFISEPNIIHLYHSIEYFLPLAVLDTFHVKHYNGVGDDVIARKREDWIQTTRALPESAPKLQDVIVHILVAIFLYDALFFVIHYSFHKNQTLYRMLHKKHHTHDIINAKATDHQHWIERIIFILAANAGLKVQGAHPLTRMIFVFVFISFLLYNHGGYDFPWMPDKVIPGGMFSGARQHYEHHAKGKRHYQFIFTYLDKGLERWQARTRDQIKQQTRNSSDQMQIKRK